ELHAKLAAASQALRDRSQRHAWLVLVLVIALVVAIGAGIGTSCYFAWQAAREAEIAREMQQMAMRKAEEANDALMFQLEAREAAHQAQRQARCALQIQLAQQAWDEGNAAKTEDCLDEIEPAFRDNWEWRYVAALTRKPGTVLQGHTGTVLAVAFTPD